MKYIDAKLTTVLITTRRLKKMETRRRSQTFCKGQSPPGLRTFFQNIKSDVDQIWCRVNTGFQIDSFTHIEINNVFNLTPILFRFGTAKERFFVLHCKIYASIDTIDTMWDHLCAYVKIFSLGVWIWALIIFYIFEIDWTANWWLTT